MLACHKPHNATPPHPANCPHPLGLPTLKYQQQLPFQASLRVKAKEMTAVYPQTSARLVLEVFTQKYILRIAGPAPRIKQAKIFVSASPTHAANKLK